MATVDITDWDARNTATTQDLSDGTSVSGLQKVQPIKVTEGTGSGTGDVQFSSSTWSNISSKDDIVVTESDESTTRAYEIEELDTSNNVAWIWVYGSWNSGSDEMVVGAGTGDGTDYSMSGTGSNPWGQTGSYWTVQHKQDDPLTGTDSSPSGNDGTVNGASSISDGQYDGAGSLDGTDDDITLPSLSFGGSGDEKFTFIQYFRTSTSNDVMSYSGTDGTSGESKGFYVRFNDGGGGDFTTPSIVVRWSGLGDNDSKAVYQDISELDGNWHQLAATVDESSTEVKLYVDGDLKDTMTGFTDHESGSWTQLIGDWLGGGGDGGNDGGFAFPGDLDETKLDTNTVRGANWIQADYDASPKGGQTFFSWSGEETTNSATATFDAATQHRQNGVVDLDGSTVSGAEVHAYNITQQVNIGHDQTDSNGEYQIDPSNVGDIASGDKLMIAVYYEQGDGDDFGQVKVTVV